MLKRKTTIVLSKSDVHFMKGSIFPNQKFFTFVDQSCKNLALVNIMKFITFILRTIHLLIN